jgi:integrase
VTKAAVKPRAYEAYDSHRRNCIEPMLGKQRLALIDQQARQEFVRKLSAQGLAPKTVRGVYGTLGLVLKLAAGYGLCRPVERSSIVLPRVVRRPLAIPNPVEVEQLAGAIDARAWALVLTAGYTWLRLGELLALAPADVEWLKGRVYVHRSVSKTTREIQPEPKSLCGHVTLPTRAAEALSRHVAEYPCDSLVFHHGGEVLSPSTLDNWWRDALKRCGLAYRFHDLRHSAASLMIAAGWSVKRVQTEMRNADRRSRCGCTGTCSRTSSRPAARRSMRRSRRRSYAQRTQRARARVRPGDETA